MEPQDESDPNAFAASHGLPGLLQLLLQRLSLRHRRLQQRVSLSLFLQHKNFFANISSVFPRSFYEHGSPESNFVILDPLNENNNTTKNSFLTHEIIKSFRKAFNKLKSLLLQYQ